MAESFLTTYNHDFTNYYPGHKRRNLKIPVDIFDTKLEGEYLEPPDKNTRVWTKESLDLIKNLYLNRLKTIYQTSYCDDKTKANKIDEASTSDVNIFDLKLLRDEPKPMKEDVLITYFSTMYKTPKTQKVLPPLQSGRRINGVTMPTWLYTQLSEYQETHCRVGYGIFKKDFDMGISRLGSRRKKSL